MAWHKKGIKMEKLSKSLEVYLFGIFEIYQKKEKITPKKLGEIVGFNRASTLDAVKLLSKKGFVEFIPYKKLELTKKGLEYIKKVNEKKIVVSSFLEKFLLVEKNELKKAVDSIEYSIDDYLLDRFNYFLDFLNFCPCSAPKWIDGFKSYLKNGEMTDRCAKCIEKTLTEGKHSECMGCKVN